MQTPSVEENQCFTMKHLNLLSWEPLSIYNIHGDFLSGGVLSLKRFSNREDHLIEPCHNANTGNTAGEKRH